MVIKIKRILIYIINLLIVLSILTSCTTTPKQVVEPIKNKTGKVTLKCVIPFDDEKKKDAFKDFETDVKSEFPDYDIKLDFIKGDVNAYNTKIKVMMFSDTPPDIFYSGDENFTEELYSEKNIQPLEKKLDAMDYWNLVIPSAKLVGNTGHIYAVPIDEVYYNVMLLNTDLFYHNNVKIPESFEELKSAVEEFKGKNITPIALGGKDGLSAYNMIESFAGTMDNEITSKIINGKTSFSGDTFKQATTSVKQLIELGAFPEKTETVSDEEAGDLFYASKAAIYCTSSDKLNTAYTKLKGKIAVLYYPNPSKLEQITPINIVSGGAKKDSGLLVSASTSYPTESAKLAVEMSKYYNKYLYEKQGDDSILYNSDKMKWNASEIKYPLISELMSNAKQENTVNPGLFEDNLSSDKEKSIEEASTEFMTGILPVSDYLKELDIVMKLK